MCRCGWSQNDPIAVIADACEERDEKVALAVHCKA